MSSVVDAMEVKEEQVEVPLNPESNPEHHAKAPHARYKSWRKKYRKMKEHFDRRMDEATVLFVAEHKATDIARRLKEQNDQLLEILLDLNEDPRVPVQNHYSLESIHSTIPCSLPPRSPKRPLEVTSRTSHNLANLERTITHTFPNLAPANVLPADLRLSSEDATYPGYLSVEQEASYTATDDKLALQLPPSHTISTDSELILPPSILHPEPKQPVTEHDFAVQHPISVHNWLRKHQPHIYSGSDPFGPSKDGGDPDSFVAPRRKTPPPSRRSKKDKERIAERERRAEAERRERAGSEEFGDEDSVFAGEEAGDGYGSIKGRRKRDDETYRPKGGSSRAAKRKRGDTIGEGSGGMSGGSGGGGGGGVGGSAKKQKRSDLAAPEDGP